MDRVEGGKRQAETIMKMKGCSGVGALRATAGSETIRSCSRPMLRSKTQEALGEEISYRQAGSSSFRYDRQAYKMAARARYILRSRQPVGLSPSLYLKRHCTRLG